LAATVAGQTDGIEPLQPRRVTQVTPMAIHLRRKRGERNEARDIDGGDAMAGVGLRRESRGCRVG